MQYGRITTNALIDVRRLQRHFGTEFFSFARTMASAP
jgi:hypothetical protein